MLTKCHIYTILCNEPVIMFSDCSGITGFERMDLPSITNKRFASLKSKMMPYTFEICHIPGIKYSIADALSRPRMWFSSSAEWKARTNVEIGLPEELKSESGKH